ncbi:MAG: BatA domain-containing protein, partial [Verrucomicrobiota bacterium]|nr:BatA domain-containing protein [Verrucomicrobiota bacterium]
MNDFVEWERLGLAEPQWLFLLLVIPLAIWMRREGKIREASLKFPTLATIKQAGRGRVKTKRWIPFLLRYSSIVFLVVAIARP